MNSTLPGKMYKSHITARPEPFAVQAESSMERKKEAEAQMCAVSGHIALQMVDDQLIDLISNSEAKTSTTPTPRGVAKTSCL